LNPRRTRRDTKKDQRRKDQEEKTEKKDRDERPRGDARDIVGGIGEVDGGGTVAG
jgi:hypothetical protein